MRLERRTVSIQVPVSDVKVAVASLMSQRGRPCHPDRVVVSGNVVYAHVEVVVPENATYEEAEKAARQSPTCGEH